MHWSLEMLEHVLELYKEKKILWDTRHPKHNNKAAREKVLQWIAEQLDVPNLTGADIGRKLRTMRAAYKVELRNISAGKARGFFYNPTLKWFLTYKACMDEIDAMKYNFKDFKDMQESDEISLEEEEYTPNTYVLKIKDKKKRENTEENSRKKKRRAVVGASHFNAELYAEMTRDLNSPNKEEDIQFDSDDSNDEFQLFADHIAEQLRAMPNLSRALLLENQILRMFAKDRKLHTMQESFKSF